MLFLKKIIGSLFFFPVISILAQNIDTFKYSHYTGTIGKKIAITADLCFENDSAISGYYYFDDIEIPKPLNGIVKPDKSIILTESSRDNDQIAEINAHLSQNGSINGTFCNTKTGKKSSFTLSVFNDLGSIPLKGYILKENPRLINTENSPTCSIKYCLLLPDKNFTGSNSDSIEHYIYSGFFGKIPPGNAQEKLQISADSTYMSYKTMNADTNGYGENLFFLSWDFTNIMKVKYNSKSILSVEFSMYYYLGGAHGGYGSSFLNIAQNSGEKILLKDIFKEGSEQTLKYALNKALRKSYNLKPADKLSLAGYSSDSIDTVTDNFYLTTQGIGFFYNPYEIASYAMGTTDIFVLFNDVLAIINEDFLKKISDTKE